MPHETFSRRPGGCRDGFDPVIRLGVGSFKSKFGPIKKPVLSIVGKVPSNGAVKDEPPFDDRLEF